MADQDLNELVSVIIPVYNGEKFVAASIESVLKQTYSPIDIIVINDGSTDGTQEILNQFGSKIIVIQQKNAGQADARNHGLTIAKGKYIALLDSDDLFVPEKIEKQISFLKKGNLDMVCTNFETIDASNKKLKDISAPHFHSTNALTTFITGNFICTSTLLFKKEWIQKVGNFDINMKGAEDGDLWFRMLVNGARLEVIHEALVKYRVHAENFSGRFSHMNQFRALANRKQYQLLKEKMLFSSVDDKLFLASAYANQLTYEVAVEVLNDIPAKDIPISVLVKKRMYSFMSSAMGTKILSGLKKMKSIVKS
ncbi:MAG: glycosyltransferase [Bacteroidia bacterium]|nr:glycosyltransferase [Bacteroidia bacterium]